MSAEEERPVQELDADSGSVRVRITLPEGYKFLPDGQHSVHVRSSDPAVLVVPAFEVPDLSFDWRVPVEVRGEGEAELRLQAMVFFCPVSDESICMFGSCDVAQPVVVRAASGGRVEIHHEILPVG